MNYEPRTMNAMKILFFGSTSDSVIVLNTLSEIRNTKYEIRISCIVTQPPKPVGRKQLVTPTPVEAWAVTHKIPVLSFPSDPEKPSFFASEQTVIDALEPFRADMLISASYGQKIPTKTITDAKNGALNVHPSILPRWRGGDPVPWAIVAGDHQIGVTIVSLSENFDEGKIIAQKKIPLPNNEYADPLRSTLFALGAELLIDTLHPILASQDEVLQGIALTGSPQNSTHASYARKFHREDGYLPWEFLGELMAGVRKPTTNIPKVFEKLAIDDYVAAVVRAHYALSPWPGLWTTININNEEKRLKILAVSDRNTALSLDSVQLEGKNPVSYAQFAQAYLAPASPAGR